eukprot:TRINITY_DN6330_c0_g1_i2.p1 TRINITY_DN6330_c0_g1~~TRINITY_DN6330_c0_g1_i2.p1  ORF type:complete len:335 (+),score=81.98 TRINITY_DN6330_c0_g1_i2:42-1046(+)
MNKIIIFLSFGLLSISFAERSVTVDTKYGTLSGVKENTAIVWKGVPFAAPPIGENRWRDPQPLSKWTGVRNATEFAMACPQGATLMPPAGRPAIGISEDCLYLNVYSPIAESSSALPVLFFIYGGGFQMGDASALVHRAQKLAEKSNNIIVVPNYRVAAFGFLNLGGNITGNFGLKDQAKAMQWVQENIAAFGGDPNRVTLFGQSAGAMSVGIHLTSPFTEGLFQRAIMQSNPLGIGLRVQKNAVKVGRLFMKFVGCADENCLRRKSMNDLVKAGDKFLSLINNVNLNGTGFTLPWGPTVDGVIVVGQPIRLFSQGKFRKIPLVSLIPIFSLKS